MLLKPGMTANVTIVTAKRDDVLRIPLQALRFRPHERRRAGNLDALWREEVVVLCNATATTEITDAEHRGQQGGAEQHDAANVEVPVRPPGDVGDEDHPEYDQDDADRDIDQEDATPGPVRHEDPAEDGPDDPADREDAGEQPDRAVPVLAEQVGDNPVADGMNAPPPMAWMARSTISR